MVKLRKGAAYRALERPYTRVSKYRKKSFVRARPHNKIVRYNMGDCSKVFPLSMELLSKDDMQLRHNALESGRLSANKVLEENLGKTGYRFILRVYPHHILRENPLASGAGADRMSTGMTQSFGKPIGIAAQVRRGQIIFELGIEKQHMDIGRKALMRALHKLPCSCTIRVKDNKPITS